MMPTWRRRTLQEFSWYPQVWADLLYFLPSAALLICSQPAARVSSLLQWDREWSQRCMACSCSVCGAESSPETSDWNDSLFLASFRASPCSFACRGRPCVKPAAVTAVWFLFFSFWTHTHTCTHTYNPKSRTSAAAGTLKIHWRLKTPKCRAPLRKANTFSCHIIHAASFLRPPRRSAFQDSVATHTQYDCFAGSRGNCYYLSATAAPSSVCVFFFKWYLNFNGIYFGQVKRK